MRLLLLLLAAVWVAGGCFHKTEGNGMHRKDKATQDSNIAADTPKIIKPVTRYYFYAFDADSIDNLKKAFTDSQLQLILTLNRIDFSKLHNTDTLVVPDTFVYDLAYYAPFPDTLALLAPVYKIILFSYPIQAFAAYQNGKLQRWGPVSMGKEATPTPSGLLHTNWRSKETISTDDSTWILKWYFNIENMRGVSMHEYELPGYPASHACIRLRSDDARWFYEWAQQWRLSKDRMQVAAYGTPVIVFGCYNYGQAPPWYQLVVNPLALAHPADSLEKEINPFLPLILERQAQRECYFNPFAQPL